MRNRKGRWGASHLSPVPAQWPARVASHTAARIMIDEDFTTVPSLSYSKPNENDFPRPSSWHSALSNILSVVESSNAPSPIVLFQNNKYLCIYDKYPKAKFHCLLLPRGGLLRVSTLNELTPHHLQELTEFHTLAGNIVNELQKSTRVTFKLGYHAIPSLSPLHLHMISNDFDSPCIKTQQHIQSFTTSFFITPDALETHLESAFVSSPDKSLYVDIRKCRAESIILHGDLKCTKCDRLAVNVPDWKRHNQKCNEVNVKKSRANNVLLGWSWRDYSGA